MRLWRIFVRRKHFVIILMLLGTALNANNLIMDPDCDHPEQGELAISEGKQQGTLIHFEENLSWNRCWKLELKRYTIRANGNKTVNLCVRIGGNKKQSGFPCAPNTVYSFSLEIKGNAPRAMLDSMNGTMPKKPISATEKKQNPPSTYLNRSRNGRSTGGPSKQVRRQNVPHCVYSSGVMTGATICRKNLATGC